jgi:hypothetical protein
MSRHRKLESLAKTSSVLVGVLLSAVLTEAFLPNRPSEHRWICCQPGRGISLKDYIPGIDKVKNLRTLVLALSTTSPHCSDSAEFYRRLERERAKDVRLVAIFPEFVPLAIARKYLQDEGVHVDEVQQLFLEDIGINGTPTLILLDDSGTVLDAWLGKLPPREEDEVIIAVKRPPELHDLVRDGPGAKTVDIYTEFRRDAVRIVRIAEAGQDVLPGRYQGPYLPGKLFLAGDHWLKDLSFTLKNRTSKNVVCLGFTFIFAEDNNLESPVFWKNTVSWWMYLGEIPEITFGAFNLPGEVIPKGTGKPLQFAPRTEMTVSLADQAEDIREAIVDRGHSLASIRKCVVVVDVAYFEDGMRWGEGGHFPFSYVDKRFSNSWLQSDASYFPGDLNPMSRVPAELNSQLSDEDM